MDDKDEYMYAWRTANCLLKTIKTFTPPYTPTYAVLDLGGPSTLNRVRACVHVLGYAARGGRAQLRSADQWPQLCVVSVLVFWGSASFMHGHASGLDVNVSGYEAEGGRGEPVSCEGDTENKDEALDVKRKATMDGWTLGLSMHVIRSCSLCRRKTCTSFSTPSFIFPTFFVSVSLCHFFASSSLLPPSFLFHSLEVIYEYGVGARMSCVLYWDNTEI